MSFKNIKNAALSGLPAVLTVLSGAVLFGVAVNMFLVPHGIVTGGATGAATVLYSLWGLPVGVGIISVNLPLFFICIRERGLSQMLLTLVGTLLSSVATDVLSFLPTASDELLLSAILGGTLMGAGASLMLSHGLTTGGSDLCADLIHKRHPSLSTARMILFIDGVIILTSAAVTGELSGIMYSVVSATLYSVALDTVQNYMERTKAVLIISDDHLLIAEKISSELCRGVTVLSATGYFSQKSRPVLLSVVRRSEEHTVRRLALRVDPRSFIITVDASFVVGKGFGERQTDRPCPGKGR